MSCVEVVLASALLLIVYDGWLCVAFWLETKRRAEPTGARRLAPDQVSLRHALLFLGQKANYYWQLVTAVVLLARLYWRPRPASDRSVLLLIINTSLATWLSSQPLDGGAVAIRLAMEGFAFPLFPGRYDVRLLVEGELRSAGGELQARMLRFELDGVGIESRAEQLSILAMMISSVSHPVIHSFNNVLYANHADPRLREFDAIFRHGQYLNHVAWFYPGLLFRIGPRGHLWYRRVLSHNAELPVPAHDRATMAALLPWSRSLRFLLGAREVLYRLCRRYELAIDPELLFICSILHSIDHVSCDRYTRGHVLRHAQLPNRGFFNFIALLYYRPAQYVCTNLLVDRRREHPFYDELYAELRRIDPALADQVTLSIAY